MELIVKLEESIYALTDEIKRLRGENKKLREEVASANELLEQNYALESLIKERDEAINAASLSIEKLLNVVRENLSEEADV